MLSVCRGPVQCGPARLEPLFTQPLRPDWEALFSHPGAFQRKPPAEAPRIRYTTLKTIHTASFPPARCVPRLHTHHIKNTEGVWNIPAEAACGMSATQKSCFPLLTRTAMLSTSSQLTSIASQRCSPQRGFSFCCRGEPDLQGAVCSKRSRGHR